MYIPLLPVYLALGEQAAESVRQQPKSPSRHPHEAGALHTTRLRRAWLSTRSPKFLTVGLAVLLQGLTGVLRASACLRPELLPLCSLDSEQAVPELN